MITIIIYKEEVIQKK